MIAVVGDVVRTCCTGEGEFGIKRGNIGVLAGFGLFLAGILNNMRRARKPIRFSGAFYIDNRLIGAYLRFDCV